MNPIRRLLVLLGVLALLTACGGQTDSTTAEEAPVDPSPSSPSSSSSGPPDVVRAVDDLATTLGVDAGTVEVVATEEVTWRDGSRGCAKPGDRYTQALIDGLRITLRVDGTDYEYHSGGSQPPFLCEDPTQ